MTCAFTSCETATGCSLVLGCVHQRPLAPPDIRPSTVAYNPMMGSRLDLKVEEEPEAVAAARWRARRIVYLQVLIEDAAISEEARTLYVRERMRLT